MKPPTFPPLSGGIITQRGCCLSCSRRNHSLSLSLGRGGERVPCRQLNHKHVSINLRKGELRAGKDSGGQQRGRNTDGDSLSGEPRPFSLLTLVSTSLQKATAPQIEEKKSIKAHERERDSSLSLSLEEYTFGCSSVLS